MDMTAYFAAVGVAIAVVAGYAFLAKTSRTPTWLVDMFWWGILGLAFLVMFGDNLFLFHLIPLGVRRVIQSSDIWPRFLLAGVLFYAALFIMLGRLQTGELDRFAKALSPVILPVIDGARVSREGGLRFTGSYAGHPISVKVAPGGLQTLAHYVIRMDVPMRGTQWCVRYERSQATVPGREGRGRFKINSRDDRLKQRLIAAGVMDVLAAWTADPMQRSPEELGTLVWSYTPARPPERGGFLEYCSPLRGGLVCSLTSEQFRARLDLLTRLHQMTGEVFDLLYSRGY